jgi:hypothetical protein
MYWKRRRCGVAVFIVASDVAEFPELSVDVTRARTRCRARNKAIIVWQMHYDDDAFLGDEFVDRIERSRVAVLVGEGAETADSAERNRKRSRRVVNPANVGVVFEL